MDIYLMPRDTASFKLTVDGTNDVKLRFEPSANDGVSVWLSPMTAQRLLGELARLYPAPPLTEADVDQLAARYAVEHAGELAPVDEFERHRTLVCGHQVVRPLDELVT